MNIWGIRRVCDTLLMLNVWFAFSALAAFSVLREFIFSEKVPLSFLHSPVTPVWTGWKNQLDRCSPDYTPQDGPVNLIGEDNGLAGGSCHDLLDCPCKSSWAVTAARPHPAHPPRRQLGLFHVFRPICLAACLGYLAYS